MEDPRQDKVGEQGGEVEVEVGPGEDRSLGAERVYRRREMGSWYLGLGDCSEASLVLVESLGMEADRLTVDTC